MSYKGIDVSHHNGDIQWDVVKKHIDFAIIRVGYGLNFDSKFISNIEGCIKNQIDFGLYWFSYALSENDALKEADYICDIADIYNPTFPLAFDWEYESDNYAVKNKVIISSEKRNNFAKIFLNRVKERGYTPMLYTNIDYINKGFKELIADYDIWLAYWGDNKPLIKSEIWQNSNNGAIQGITGKVDTNICYIDYSKVKNNDDNILDLFNQKFLPKYKQLANDIILGKYGNSTYRKMMVNKLGYDYNLVQEIVNYLLKG